MLNKIKETTSNYLTFHPCRLCVRPGGAETPNRIPKPDTHATEQEKTAYELSICSDCIIRLKVALS